MYVIQRNDGAFVSKTPVFGSSYTRQLQKAQTYRTKEEAERELCPENERVVSLQQVMYGG